MPGFLVTNKNTDILLRDRYPERCVYDRIQITNNRGVAIRQTLNKFLQDKAFEETERFLIIAEGYLLNKTSLFKEYNVTSIVCLFESMFCIKGEKFFEEFRGCFSGAIYDKQENKWIIFTNQIGDNPIFYVYESGLFAAGSQVQYLLDYCREQNMDITINEDCAYQMLTYGYVPSDDTFAKQITRLKGGNYIVVENGEINVKTYHRFEIHPERYSDKSESEIVELIDDTFRKAVQMEWEKDTEYGYRHLADLSGGLDSRMNMWVAHEMQDRHVLVLTYSKEGELDETIAKQIAGHWKDELLFKPLDDFSFMMDIDDNTFLLGGLSLYSGITGGKRLLEGLNLSDYGIEHTGMVGDICLGSFYHTKEELLKKTPTGRYSEKLAEKLPDRIKEYKNLFSDYEIYLMYARGFHGACNSHLIRRNYTEVGSPFLNIDFMQLCYDIPVEMRMHHNLYKKWIISEYPQAAMYKWEKIGGKITDSELKLKFNSLVQRGPRKVLRMMGFNPKKGYGMNPLDYWYSQRQDVKEYLDNYELIGLDRCKGVVSDVLLKDADWLYKNGNVMEKTMTLTVLSAICLYKNR